VSKTKIKSAGVLLYRIREEQLEVFIGHMGGPFWAKKDDRGWSIPKGEYQPEEDPLAAAKREFAEEIGSEPPEGDMIELGEHRQPSGKRIIAWAIEGDFDPAEVRSNTFEAEWPPRSGKTAEFPEIDRAAWFDLATAEQKLVRGQVPFLDALEEALRSAGLRLRPRGLYERCFEAPPVAVASESAAAVQSALF
jgi:predicted NUDIX family NTP pyrophosphohydrolase